MENNLVSISKAAKIFGVSISTLRRWESEGKLNPIKTYGNHRRYKLDDVEYVCKEETEKSSIVKVATYSRVSSHEQKQKGDLERQNGRILSYCVDKKYHVVKSFEEVGSGMCATRSKLSQLFRMVSNKEINKVIIEHKDRLTRFNFEFLVEFFGSHNVEIEWTDNILSKSFENELVEDMLSLLSSFSNKIYGRRSSENRKKKKLLEQQKEEKC